MTYKGGYAKLWIVHKGWIMRAEALNLRADFVFSNIGKCVRVVWRIVSGIDEELLRKVMLEWAKQF